PVRQARARLGNATSSAIGVIPIVARAEHTHVGRAKYAISGSAAGTSLGTLERRERFYVMRVGEEIDEVERGQAPPGRDQPARVSRKGYRIAREITNDRARPAPDRLDDAPSRAGARRIEKNEISVR